MKTVNYQFDKNEIKYLPNVPIDIKPDYFSSGGNNNSTVNNTTEA